MLTRTVLKAPPVPHRDRDWFAIVVIVIEIALGLVATAGVYAAFHSY